MAQAGLFQAGASNGRLSYNSEPGDLDCEDCWMGVFEDPSLECAVEDVYGLAKVASCLKPERCLGALSNAMAHCDQVSLKKKIYIYIM